MSELAVGSIAGLASNNFVVDVASGSSLDLSNGATLPAGSIVQVVSTTKSTSFAVSSTSYVDWTGVAVTITPKSSSNTFIVFVNAPQIQGDTNNSLELEVQGNGTSLSGFMRVQHYNTNTTTSGTFVATDSPATSSSLTYKARVKSPNGATETLLSGVITVMEVAG